MLAQLTSNKYLKDAFLSLFSMFLTYTKSRKYIARNKKNVHVPMLVLKICFKNIYIRLMSKISKDNDLTLFFTIKDVSFYIISLYRSHSLELCLWMSKEPLKPGTGWYLLSSLVCAVSGRRGYVQSWLPTM